MKPYRDFDGEMKRQFGKKLYRFPGFCLQCGFKYAGYLLGKHYKKLPRSLVMRITTNREYWRQEAAKHLLPP